MGTHIQTPGGLIDIENLTVGDMVDTADNGPQPVRWIGRRSVVAKGRFAPICFAPGAIGNDRTLYLSPLHRVLMCHWQAELITGCPEVLVAAKHLVNDNTIRRTPTDCHVTYFHILLDRHEVVFADGAAVETT